MRGGVRGLGGSWASWKVGCRPGPLPRFPSTPEYDTKKVRSIKDANMLLRCNTRWPLKGYEVISCLSQRANRFKNGKSKEREEREEPLHTTHAVKLGKGDVRLSLVQSRRAGLLD